MKHNTAKQKQTGLFEAMKGKFGYKNMLQAPRIEKVILSSTTGSVKEIGRASCRERV